MTSKTEKISWAQIRQDGYFLPVFILCIGVFIYGSDYAFGATIIPIAVQEIGGEHLINWVISIFELGAIMSALSVPILAGQFSIIRIANVAVGLYVTACLMIASAPSMEIIIAGRLLQGMGGGIFISLALVITSTIFPQKYFIRLMALVSAIWGASSFTGPLIGGIFAELGVWRGGYLFMGCMAILLVISYNLILLPFLRKKHPESMEPKTVKQSFPIIRLLALALSVLFLASAGVVKSAPLTLLLVAIGAAMFFYMIWRDKRSKINIFPRSMFTATPTGFGMFVAMLAPMGAIAMSTYGPIFMQIQFGLTPIMNGYVIVLISVAWSVGAFSVGHLPPQVAPTMIRLGMILVAISQIGMGLGFYYDNFSLIPIFAMVEGAGFGVCWSFIAQRTIRLAPKADKERVATSMFTMQRIGFSIGAALLGIVVNGLGFNLDISIANLRIIGFLTMIAPLPLVLFAIMFAWKIANQPLEDE